MKRLALALLAACGSSSPSSPDGPPGSHDAPGGQPGFQLRLDGQDYTSSGHVVVRDDHGHFGIESDLGVEPSVAVRIRTSALVPGSYPCVRSASNDAFDETAATIDWLDGNTYYTNVFPNPTCTATITAVSASGVTGSIAGKINKQVGPDYPAVDFTLSFAGTPM